MRVPTTRDFGDVIMSADQVTVAPCKITHYNAKHACSVR